LPSALGNLGVGRGQICPRNMQVQDGLPVGFVLGMKQRQSFGFVLSAQAVLLPGTRPVAVPPGVTP
jgi:hypothetical protein